MEDKKICLIKAGSAVVTRKDGTLDYNTPRKTNNF